MFGRFELRPGLFLGGLSMRTVRGWGFGRGKKPIVYVLVHTMPISKMQYIRRQN